MTQVADIHGDVFSTRSEQVGQRLCVELTGCLDMETAPALEAFLGALPRALSSERIREIEFATGGLFLMSSSAFSHLAAWVKRLKQLCPGSCIRFKTNPNLTWQRRTFDSIRRVAESIVVVD